MKQKKQQIAYERLNEFFAQIIEEKRSGKLERFLKFITKMPQYAPFNNAIVFAQNPDCFYYATKTQWQNKFKRTIKRGARPMIILMPFGPIEFVYDCNDTDGEAIDERELLHWWEEENRGFIKQDIIKRTIENCNSLGIDVVSESGRKYIEESGLYTMGHASKHTSGSRKIVLHPRYNSNSPLNYSEEAYGVLCHEIAHHLLGPLGKIEIPKKKKDGKIEYKTIVKERYVKKNMQEFEAELVAWMVFQFFNLEKDQQIISLDGYKKVILIG